MNTKLIYLFLLMPLLILSSCDDDEAPKTTPVVTTAAPTNITTTSATVGGEITGNGNDPITKSGVVYSRNIALPTLEDNKIEATVDQGKFSASLTGLSSGATYHVRAFATNGVGTSYGDVLDFTLGNAAPTVRDVLVDGMLEVAKTVTAKYTYNDAEQNVESGTTFQWYVADNAAGAAEAPIAGATQQTFTIQEIQNGKYLRVAVTPRAGAGTSTGAEVKSAYTTAIGAETVTFKYNEETVTYGTMISTATQKKWLDRNLGAGRVAQTIDDYRAYGDLFQWGRGADGHQIVKRAGGNDEDMSSDAGTTSITSDIDKPGSGKFILNAGFGTGDWRTTPNNDLWQGSTGINNPCPAGWRIPTKDEWVAEGFKTGVDAFAKLKIPYTGSRERFEGSFFLSTGAMYWASTRLEEPDMDGQLGASFIYLDETMFEAGGTDGRAAGHACRCIKN